MSIVIRAQPLLGKTAFLNSPEQTAVTKRVIQELLTLHGKKLRSLPALDKEQDTLSLFDPGSCTAEVLEVGYGMSINL